MKKLFFLLLSAVLFSTVARAQDENRENGKVILKNGSVVEGTISKQGNDVVVTTAAGDVFYYSSSEVARISSDSKSTRGLKVDVNSRSAASKDGFKAFKKNTKAAYREAKAFGTDINEYWGTNDRAKYYYEKSRKWNKAAWITASVGGAVVVSGVIFNVAYLATFEEHYYSNDQGSLSSYAPEFNEGYFAATIAAYVVGGTALLASCLLPIGSHINLKRSYEYYDHDGKAHAAVFNASPVLYAQGGAGIGVTLNF